MGKRLNRRQGFRPTRKAGLSTTVFRCRRCSLIYANPQPIPARFDEHYGMSPDEYWDASYFDFDPGYFSGQIETFRSLHGGGGKRALDIGAGGGKCMRSLEAAGFDAYGLEPSEPFHRRAISHSKIDPQRLQLASLQEAVYPSASFDFITFGAVLEHLQDPSSSILKALDLTSPGGVIHIEVPSSAFLTTKLLNLIYRLQGLDYVSNICPMHPPFHLYEFAPKSFEFHARMHGYEVALQRLLSVDTMLPKFLDPILKPLMRITGTVMQLEVWLRKSAAPA